MLAGGDAISLELTHTCDFLDQLCDGRVVGQGASGRLHVRQLRHKLLDFHHRLGIVAFLEHTRDHHTLASQPLGRPHAFASVAVATGSKQRTIAGGEPAYLGVLSLIMGYLL